MRSHANARLSPIGRQVLVDRVERDGWSVAEAAAAQGISTRTAFKWLARARAGEPLTDRSSARKTQATRTPVSTVTTITALRKLRFSGPEIADLLELPTSTVCAVLKREGMGRLGRIGLEPAERYERARPGELIHIDVKKLGRIKHGAGKRFTAGKSRNYRPSFTDLEGRRRLTAGWDFVHVCVDDATRLAYAEVLADEKATTAIAFLRRAVKFFERHGIEVQRLLTDNGSPYRATSHAVACRALGIRHLRTRPRRPQTNGKAERFIRTMLDGWAYGAIYASSAERTGALDGWLWHYNHRRRHAALSRQTPAQRLNNLTGTYT
jgi:transposase InsO family protein